MIIIRFFFYNMIIYVLVWKWILYFYCLKIKKCWNFYNKSRLIIKWVYLCINKKIFILINIMFYNIVVVDILNEMEIIWCV